MAAISPRKFLTSSRTTVATWLTALRSAAVGAGPEREIALLTLKTVLATVLAWQFAAQVVNSPTPYYAPLAALLVVDHTLVRSFWTSAQRLIAVTVGMGIAWLIGSSLGVHWWSMAMVMLPALLIGRWRVLGNHGLQVPSMVLLSLLTANGTSETLTVITIGETIAGGVIGVATNAIVFAPLHIDESREAVDKLTGQVRDLINDISRRLRTEWDEETTIQWRQLSTEILDSAPDAGERVAKGHESTRFNPRGSLRGVQIDWAGYSHTVNALHRTQWHVSGIVTTLVDAADSDDPQPWPSPTFLSTYADAVAAISSALSHFGRDEEGEQESVNELLGEATALLGGLEEQVPQSRAVNPRVWPAYGALVIDAKRIIRELAEFHEVAAVPTDSSPFRRKLFERWRS